MKLSKLVLSVVAIVAASTWAQAQDIITFRSGESISVDVVRIGTEEVTYTELDNAEVEISVEKSTIAKIDMESGNVYTFNKDNSLINVPDYDTQKSRAIRAGLLTPMYGSFRLEYEQNLKPGHSVLGTLTGIGIGLDVMETNPSGVALSVGYKLLTSPTYYLERQRRSHRMHGSYFMAELAYSNFGTDEFVGFYDDAGIYQEYTGRMMNTGAALIFSYGYQYVIQNVVSIDWSVGIGYGYTDRYTNDSQLKDAMESDYYYGYFDDMPSTMHGFYSFGNTVPLAWRSRLSIGIML